MYFQLLADEIVPNRVQIVSYHPGQIYNDAFAQMGVPKEGLDDGESTGSLSSRALEADTIDLQTRCRVIVQYGWPAKRPSSCTGV